MDELSQKNNQTLLESHNPTPEQKIFWKLGVRAACVEVKSLISELLLQIDDPEIAQKIDKFWEKIRFLEKEL